MSFYRKIFPKKNTLLIVIHVEDKKQALRNSQIAKEEGVDGIFLINHSIPSGELLFHYDEVRMRFPDLWIGLNFLDLPTIAAIQVLPRTANGLWVDNAGIVESPHESTAQAAYYKDLRTRSWKNDQLYFGSIAFKYQMPVKDPARAAELAIPYVDIITTSGAGTGIAAEVEKIRIMKNAIGEHPLAIASGVTPENVSEYLEYADCFLVATGVSKSHTELDASRVRKLVQKISP